MRTILVSLLVPPFGLVTLAVAALVLHRWRPVLAFRVLVCAIAGLVLLGMPIVPDTLLVALERTLPTTPPADDPPQAIVVLGAEIVRNAGEDPPARIGRLSLERVREAAELYRRTHLPILVSGGETQKGMPTVADIMALSLRQDFQVPVAWVENRSRNTWENATDSAAILRAQGIHSIYVVTHGWHMRRALMSFARTGLRVTAAPTPLDRGPGPVANDFLPRAGTWEVAYYALHEWIGCAWYALH